MLQRLREAWRDLTPTYTVADLRYRQDVAAINANLAFNMDQHDPDDPNVFRDWVERENRRHMVNFPITERMVTLLFIISANLSEDQRERLVSSLSIRGYRIENSDYDTVKQTMREIFINTKTALDDPNVSRPTEAQ